MSKPTLTGAALAEALAGLRDAVSALWSACLQTHLMTDRSADGIALARADALAWLEHGAARVRAALGGGWREGPPAIMDPACTTDCDHCAGPLRARCDADDARVPVRAEGEPALPTSAERTAFVAACEADLRTGGCGCPECVAERWSVTRAPGTGPAATFIEVPHVVADGQGKADEILDALAYLSGRTRRGTDLAAAARVALSALRARVAELTATVDQQSGWIDAHLRDLPAALDEAERLRERVAELTATVDQQSGWIDAHLRDLPAALDEAERLRARVAALESERALAIGAQRETWAALAPGLRALGIAEGSDPPTMASRMVEVAARAERLARVARADAAMYGVSRPEDSLYADRRAEQGRARAALLPGDLDTGETR